MSITTYGELRSALDNWMAGRGLAAARVNEFIALAEDRIRQDQRIRIRAMETTTDLTINAQEIALPTRFVQLRRLYLNTDPAHALEWFPPEDFWAKRGPSETARPKFFTIEGENLVFAPSPDSTYTGKLLYYQSFAAFSDDSDTNWLLTNARGLYLYAAMLEADIYVGNDPRTSQWAQLYDDVADNLQKADRRDRIPSPPAMRGIVHVDTRRLSARYRT